MKAEITDKIFTGAVALLFGLMLVVSAFTTRHIAFLPGIIGLVGGGYVLFVRKERPIISMKFSLMLIGFIALGLISCLWSVNPDESIERAVKTSAVFFSGWVFIVFAMNYPVEKLAPYLFIVPVFCVMASLFLFVETVTGLHVFRLMHGIDAGTKVKLYELNKEISVQVFLLPFSLFFAYRKWGKWALPIVLVVCGLMIFYSVCQVAQVAAVIGVVVFLLFRFFPGERKILWGIACAFLIAGLWVSPIIAPYIFATTTDFFTSNPLLREASAVQRMEIWDFISQKVYEAPLTGFGMFSARFLTFNNHQLFYESAGIMHPHNVALQLWLEYGAIGAACGSAAICFLMSSCYRAGDFLQKKLSLIVFCMLFFSSLIGWGMWQAWWLGTVFLCSGLTIICIRCIDENG